MSKTATKVKDGKIITTEPSENVIVTKDGKIVKEPPPPPTKP